MLGPRTVRADKHVRGILIIDSVIVEAYHSDAFAQRYFRPELKTLACTITGGQFLCFCTRPNRPVAHEGIGGSIKVSPTFCADDDRILINCCVDAKIVV